MSITRGITSEMQASQGFGVRQKVSGPDAPVRYEPIPLRGDPTEYIRGEGEEQVLEMVVAGHHKLGYLG